MPSLLLSLFLFIGSPTASDPSLRWGADGHHIVCAIAWWELTDEAKAGIRELLDTDPTYERFMESCTWADRVRGRDARYDRYTTAHYVNIPRGETSFRLERDCANTFCVVEGIEESRDVLENPSAPTAERLDALKFLSHFVGDLHQPMHAGYADDRGGNDTMVTVEGEAYNLHRVWDSVLWGRIGRDWLDHASVLWFGISDADRKAWQDQNPTHWAEESFRIVYDSAYRLPVDDAYLERNTAIIEQRLQMGGVRLGLLLNRLFAG